MVYDGFKLWKHILTWIYGIGFTTWHASRSPDPFPMVSFLAQSEMQCTVHRHTPCYFFCRSNATSSVVFATQKVRLLVRSESVPRGRDILLAPQKAEQIMHSPFSRGCYIIKYIRRHIQWFESLWPNVLFSDDNPGTSSQQSCSNVGFLRWRRKRMRNLVLHPVLMFLKRNWAPKMAILYLTDDD